MKKRILIALVLFSLAASAYSQTPDISLFARTNTVWSVASYVTEVHPDDISFVFYYKLCENQHNSNVYSMKGGGSYQGYSPENIDECPVLFNVRITEDSLLYFEWPDRNPALVFDYKARVGDTITLEGYAENIYSIYKIMICDIDTIENEGHQYKMWTLSPAYAKYENGNEEWCEGCSNTFYSSVWISEIGSGLDFRESTMFKMPGFTGGLTDVLCVWYNDSIIFHNASQYRPDYDLSAYPRNYCTMEDITLTEISNMHNINIVPNPTADKISIEYDESKLVFGGLFNFLGNPIFVRLENNELDLSALSSGVYFLIFIANGKIIVEKIIKI
jgi:hypothetical protein